jgi:hypothetical protein
LINILKEIDMRNKKDELDVDFIGGQDVLTQEEEQALSQYFKQRKLIAQKAKAEKEHRPVKQTKRAI